MSTRARCRQHFGYSGATVSRPRTAFARRWESRRAATHRTTAPCLGRTRGVARTAAAAADRAARRRAASAARRPTGADTARFAPRSASWPRTTCSRGPAWRLPRRRAPAPASAASPRTSRGTAARRVAAGAHGRRRPLPAPAWRRASRGAQCTAHIGPTAAACRPAQAPCARG